MASPSVLRNSAGPLMHIYGRKVSTLNGANPTLRLIPPFKYWLLKAVIFEFEPEDTDVATVPAAGDTFTITGWDIGGDSSNSTAVNMSSYDFGTDLASSNNGGAGIWVCRPEAGESWKALDGTSQTFTDDLQLTTFANNGVFCTGSDSDFETAYTDLGLGCVVAIAGGVNDFAGRLGAIIRPLGTEYLSGL